MIRFAELMFGVAGALFVLVVAASIIGHAGAGVSWLLVFAAYGFWLLVVAGVVGYVSLAAAPFVWRHQRKGVAMKRMMWVALAVALIAAAPVGVWAAGYESRSGGSNTSESVSGVPVPGGGTRSTTNSSYDSFSRSRPVYDGWERANMTASTAVNVVGAMQSIAGLFGGLSAGPVVATPTGVYAPNGNGYGGGYGYGYGGGQVPPFVYQRAASAPPAPICYTYAGVCDVWTPQGWQRVPMPAPQPTVTVQVGPRCGYEQRTDSRGLYWQEYLCR
ncbi:hypothetical protein HYW67_00925 [Candidatus Parcubacteria bacterium]|nr:hypothetical protein [Candidatus Parcubacteria bacterium]